MFATSRRLGLLAGSTLVSLCLAGVGAVFADPLPDVKARMEIEAQRVERRFADDRLAAYKLVRMATPRSSDAAEKIYALQALLEADTSLRPARRTQLLATLKFDLDNLKKVAATHRRAEARDDALAREAARDFRRTSPKGGRPGEVDRKDRVRDIESIVGSRSKTVADARDRRASAGERRVAVGKSIEESAMLPRGNIEFPKNWVELSKRRTKGSRITAAERAIMKALDTVISVDFEGEELSNVIDALEKRIGQTIILDKQGLDDVMVGYTTGVKLKLKATTRTVLKRILSDLSLAYVVKEEKIFITSASRARQMTTTRTYYIGDLMPVVDARMPPILSQLRMRETINNLMTSIVRTVEPQSWQANNPDAPGTIMFEPVTMSLIVKQTAEVHFRFAGLR